MLNFIERSVQFYLTNWSFLLNDKFNFIERFFNFIERKKMSIFSITKWNTKLLKPNSGKIASMYRRKKCCMFQRAESKNSYAISQYCRIQKKKDHGNHIQCSARIRCLHNGTCERKNVFVQHSAHPNHESIVTDKKIMDNVAQKAIKLRTDYAEDAYRVPNRHIFQREVARY